jgi:signal recognition particle subunit SRP54
VFDNLSERLQGVLKRLRGEARINDRVLDETLREIRRALLEADVAFRVVKDFLARVREKALGQEVLASLTPGHMVVRIVRDELVDLLGGESAGAPLGSAKRGPTVVLLCGLQGSGKTTSCGKLGRHLAGKGRHPIIVPVDLARPAAVEQAARVAAQAGVAVFEHDRQGTPVSIARRGLEEARNTGRDVVLVDTAGRLHVDEALMEELQALQEALDPTEILYVADSMTGQDAVRSAADFHARVPLTGVILSKLDGDARGGAALSVAAATGVPVRFAGVGEGPEDLEPFRADRMASRVLGMGDVLSLIEKAEETVDREEAEKLERKLRRAEFTLEDFRDQLAKVKKMGPLHQVLSMIPGVSPQMVGDVDNRQVDRVVAIVNSMTPRERRDHRLMNGSRKKRVARGSGTSVTQINQLLRQFAQMKKMMRTLQKTGGRGRRDLARQLLGGR